MLAVENLEVVYNDVILVLRGISLEVPDGKIVALLGANGAGKTTTLRAVTGLLDIHEGDITKGSISLNGADITHKDPADRVKMGVSQVMEGRRVFAELTVDENLRAGAYANRDSAKVKNARDRVMTLFPRLQERRSATAGYLSGGEQQMLAVARALARDIKLLLLDEPYEGLAPVIVQEIEKILREIKELGFTTVIVEQNVIAALNLADRAVILEMGHVVYEGPAKEVLENEDLRHQYLAI